MIPSFDKTAIENFSIEPDRKKRERPVELQKNFLNESALYTEIDTKTEKTPQRNLDFEENRSDSKELNLKNLAKKVNAKLAAFEQAKIPRIQTTSVYTESNSRIGIGEEGSLNLKERWVKPKQFQVKKSSSDEGNFKCNDFSVQPEPDLESKEVYIKKNWINEKITIQYLKKEEPHRENRTKKILPIQERLNLICEEIEKAASIQDFQGSLEWVHYYIATILLEEGLSPAHKVGKKITYIEGYVTVALIIKKVLSLTKKRKQKDAQIDAKTNEMSKRPPYFEEALREPDAPNLKHLAIEGSSKIVASEQKEPPTFRSISVNEENITNQTCCTTFNKDLIDKNRLPSPLNRYENLAPNESLSDQSQSIENHLAPSYLSPILYQNFSELKQELATLEECKEIVLDLMHKNIEEIEFINIQSKKQIEGKLLLLSLIEDFQKAKLILRELRKKEIEEIESLSPFLEKDNEIYVRTKNPFSYFEKQSPEIILKTAECIKNQKNEGEIKKTFFPLLTYLGQERNRIAHKDKSYKADRFGTIRNSELQTPLQERYSEYGYKIFNLIKETYENWIHIKETKKQNTNLIYDSKTQKVIIKSPPSSFYLNLFHFEKREENENITTIKVIFYAINQFQLNICKEKENGQRETLSQFCIEPIALFSLGDPFPSFHLSKITLYHTSFSLIPSLIKELTNLFIKCLNKSSNCLKNDLAQFVYIFAHACIYHRGSAAINEWLIRAILFTHGKKSTYGRSKQIGDVFYQEVIDLDAITSSFNEFEKIFQNKLKIEKLDNKKTEIPNIFNHFDVKKAICKKLSSWKSISVEKLDELQKKELSEQKIDLFFFAIKKGIPEIVEILLKDFSIEKNPIDQRGYSLLAVATQYNRSTIFEMIWKKRKHEINLNQETQDKSTPFLHASMHNSIEIAKMVLTYPNINVNFKGLDGFSPFQIACIRNHIEFLDFLLSFRNKAIHIEKYNLQNNDKNEVNEIIKNCSKIDINDLLKNAHGSVLSPLALAAKKGFTEIVELLLSEPDIDVNQQDPLAEACENNRYTITEKLLKHPKIEITERAKKYLS